MKMIVRILNIRSHKEVTFLDCYTNEMEKRQLMIDNQIKNNYKINSGDLLVCAGKEVLNKSGRKVIKINKIESISKSSDWDFYKGINNSKDDVKRNIFINARNGGSQLELWRYKKEVVQKLKEVLINDNFEDMTTFINVVERYKNGSNVIDAEIKNRDISEPKYLRITLENQLKQACSILLKSVFSIDKAFKNMGEDSGHTNEFMLLELVSLDYKINDMIKLIEKMDDLSRTCAKSLKNENLIEKIEIIDYNDYMKKGESIKSIIKEIQNCLLINYPVFSPLVKTEEEEQVEARWYMRGKYIGHFYEDENDYNTVKSNIDKQNLCNNNFSDDINPLSYLKWGLPETVSFGISIDRWLQLTIGENNINTISNPLGLDYVKVNRRK